MDKTIIATLKAALVVYKDGWLSEHARAFGQEREASETALERIRLAEIELENLGGF